MKHLSHYMGKAQSECMDRNGAFFAFNSNQLAEGRKKVGAADDSELTKLSSGMIVLKKNVKALITELDEIFLTAIKEDEAENGKDAIILRELHNYECFYVGDIEEAVRAVGVYGYSEEDVETIFKKERKNVSV